MNENHTCQPDAIPQTLQALPRWVCWKHEERKGKSTKVPYNACTGQRASSTDTTTWTDFKTALAASTRYSGIGIVLGDGLVGLDLDDSVNGDGGLKDWAVEIVTQLNSYTEYSPSGHGVKIFLLGHLARPGNRRDVGDGHVEVYATGRYFTVTGHRWATTSWKVEERDVELDTLHQTLFPPQAAPSSLQKGTPDLSDNDLLDRMYAASNGAGIQRLWQGDTTGYPSHSEADAALCAHLAFWTGGDRVRISKLFRQSSLCRKKWIERPDYRARTITKALEGLNDTYTPRGDAVPTHKLGNLQYVEVLQDDDDMPSAGPEDPGAFPEELLTVPGFVGDVMAYCVATAHKPQPALALAGAICLQAVLAARRVCDQRGNQTNIYVVAVAESGRGKERPRQVNREILYRSGQGALEGPEEFASDSGLVKAVELQPAILFQVDEIGRLLKTIGDHRKAHLYNIASALIKLYSCAGSVFQGKAYADEKRNIAVHHPCVSLFGCTVPLHLYESLTTAAMDDGFMARLMVVESNDNPPRQMVRTLDLPNTLLERAKWWGNFRPGGNLGDEHPTPHLIPYDDDATNVFNDLAAQVDEEAEQGNAALWARVEEKACRLALIYACSRNLDPQTWVMDKAATQWAVNLSVYLTRRLIWTAARWVSDSAFDAKQKQVIRLMEAAGGVITQSRITRMFQSWKVTEREEVLTNLLVTRQIVKTQHTTGGRPRVTYRLAGGIQ